MIFAFDMSLLATMTLPRAANNFFAEALTVACVWRRSSCDKHLPTVEWRGLATHSMLPKTWLKAVPKQKREVCSPQIATHMARGL